MSLVCFEVFLAFNHIKNSNTVFKSSSLDIFTFIYIRERDYVIAISPPIRAKRGLLKSARPVCLKLRKIVGGYVF